MNKDDIQPMDYTDFIKLRMARTKKLFTLLELENKILKIRMLVSFRQLQHNINYTKVVKEISDIERRQLFNYSMSNEIHMNNLTTMVNDIKPSIDDLLKEYNELCPQFDNVKTEINNINKAIPNIIYNNDEPIAEHKKTCAANVI